MSYKAFIPQAKDVLVVADVLFYAADNESFLSRSQAKLCLQNLLKFLHRHNKSVT